MRLLPDGGLRSPVGARVFLRQRGRFRAGNPVFSGLLSPVMGVIRFFYQVLRTHLRPESRHADTYRNLEGLFQMVHGRMGDALA